jgi:hypothetical protein
MGLQRSGDDRGDVVQPGGEPPKLKVTRGPDGKLKVGGDRPDTHETVEAAERPPIGEDPRPAIFRNIPPIGPG